MSTRTLGHPTFVRESGMGRRLRFEELDQVARGILEEGLRAADTRDQFAPKAHTGSAQRLHHRGQIGHLELEAIPATWLGAPAVGQDLPTPTLPARDAQQ